MEVSQVIPAPDTADVASNATVTVMFNRPVVPLVAVSDPARQDLPQPLTLVRASDGAEVEGRGEWLNTSIYVFTPSRPLQAGQRYEGRVAAGLAKTRAIKTLSKHLESEFRRIQFTPDLLPADIIGTQIYRPDNGSFEVNKGPIFNNIILADEINRAPAKVQSALLEAMQERQVTIRDKTFTLDDPFLVLQNVNYGGDRMERTTLLYRVRVPLNGLRFAEFLLSFF